MASDLIAAPETELQHVEPRRDLRAAVTDLPIPAMQTVLAEWKDRRDAFRSWLLPQLKPGVHYGYVPGCAPRFDSAGNLLIWNSKKNQNDVVTPDQWQAKPSLYKAGAQFVADLMNLVPVFDADLAAWEQLGKPAQTFVFRCRLFPKGAEQRAETLLGEGRGCRKVGQKGGDENNAIKMAQKAAMCDAILNGYGLADLFTQDMEDKQPDEQPNPSQNDDAPKVKPRAERAAGITKEQLADLKAAWKKYRAKTSADDSKAAWELWAEAVCGIPPMVALSPANWTAKALQDGLDDLKAAGV